MRFLHTADWHLGRLFYGTHLTGDQAYILDQFIDLIRDSKPDAVLIAGDVYDRAVPPPEAVRLLDDTLCRIILDCKTPVIMLSGNHDSPDRLGFASRLLSSHLLHVVSQPNAAPSPVILEDDHGPVYLYGVPYTEPALAREVLETPEIACHQSAMQGFLYNIRLTRPENSRTILLAHAFVQGGEECESERPLSVGGAGSINPMVFDGFDYVALGHLHRPQAVGKRIHYSGSLMKYSFAEAEHRKSVSLVEMDADGTCQIERVDLTPRHDVRRISGYLADILASTPIGGSREDYLQVSLLDTDAILDPIGKLREVYPNVMQVERPVLKAARSQTQAHRDHRQTGPVELFDAFFREVTGETLSGEQRTAYQNILEEMARQEREAVG